MSKWLHLVQVILTPVMFLAIVVFMFIGVLIRFYRWVWEV